MEQERIDKVYEWADKNRIKYQEAYQLDGKPSQLRTYERYDDICEICAAASKQVAEEDVFRQRLRKTQLQIIEMFRDSEKVGPGKTFSYNEVEDLMRKMMV
jgi:hypothetical protein